MAKDDVVMRAMGDELDRSMKNLKLPNYPLPYYGHYYVTDEELYPQIWQFLVR